MAAALPAGYELLGRRGRYGRAVEVYGITRVARSSAIAFGWCTYCGVATRWKPLLPVAPYVSLGGSPNCSGPAWTCVTATHQGKSACTVWPWPAAAWRTGCPT